MAATGWKALQAWLSGLINGWRGYQFKELQALRKPPATASQNPPSPTAPPLNVTVTTKPGACMHPLEFQAVKPHVKMIKFRYGANGTTAAGGPAAANVAAATSPATPTPGNTGVQSTPVAQIQHETDVPPRYRRLPMSEEEIAYITRGGPE